MHIRRQSGVVVVIKQQGLLFDPPRLELIDGYALAAGKCYLYLGTCTHVKVMSQCCSYCIEGNRESQ